jgi:S-methylmethionine-dependent homocysteine/selenocysteine methylase
VTILDGGVGRELLRIGAPFRQPEWSALALMEAPDRVVEAHANFVAAGADVITTNSYALVPFHLGPERFAARARDLAALSGRLARRAAGAGRLARRAATVRTVEVAGSLPPLFGSYRPDLFRSSDAPAIIDSLVEGLAPHVDLWLAETLGSIAEARAVADALHRAGTGPPGPANGGAAQPLWISYTLDDDHHGALPSGEPVADAVAAAVDLGASAVLFNCCRPETITVALEHTAHLIGGRVALGGYANRFAIQGDNPANAGLSSLRPDLDPVSYADLVARWLGLGATIVGGCCGVEPDHIAQVAALVDGCPQA